MKKWGVALASATFLCMIPELGFGQCTIDSDCDDGIFCNGRESCVSGQCVAVSACPPMIDGCVIRRDVCDEENDQCLDTLDDSLCPPGLICAPDGQCVSATDIIADLIDTVGELRADGVLNRGQGNSLVRKLRKALRKLEQDRTNVTCNTLSAFTYQVRELVNDGVLTEEQGQPLIEAAEGARGLVDCNGVDDHSQASASARQYREQHDDPWVSRSRVSGEPRAVPSAPVQIGPFRSVQVNVDVSGANIPGDAANEPSIAVDPTAPNRITIGWRQFDTIASNFRQAGYAYSNDGGRTWTFPGVLEEGVFRSDPVLAADSTGNFYYMSLIDTQLTGDPDKDIFEDLFVSNDGGVSWTGPTRAFGGDKEWIAVDRTGGIGEGNLYSAWQLVSPFNPNQFTRSTDGGLTFSSPIEIPLTPIFGTLAVGPDGSLYVSGVNPADFGTYLVAKSTNAQDPVAASSFDSVTSVDLGGRLRLGAGPNPEGLLGQPWIAVDENSGNVYLVGSVDPPGTDPMDVHFVRSMDGGETWSTPIRVNDDPSNNEAWQWFGTMSVAPNGRIDVIWNDTRDDPGNPEPTSSQLRYSSSADDGVTWSASVPLSPIFDHSVGYPNNDKLGDYYHMVSDNVGAHLIYAATFNGEQDVYYLRIGHYDCNSNSVPDSDDLLGPSSDCNENEIPDECDIAAGASEDHNANGIPDECEVVVVQIDIKPGSFPNSINPQRNERIAVAILTTSVFDATTVDPMSVEFGPNGARKVHKRGHIRDSDDDGDLDLVLHFRTGDTGIRCGDTEAILRGTTFDGQPIEGTDSVRTVRCK